MIRRLRAWIDGLLSEGRLRRDARRHEAAADRLDTVLREIMQR